MKDYGHQAPKGSQDAIDGILTYDRKKPSLKMWGLEDIPKFAWNETYGSVG